MSYFWVPLNKIKNCEKLLSSYLKSYAAWTGVLLGYHVAGNSSEPLYYNGIQLDYLETKNSIGPWKSNLDQLGRGGGRSRFSPSRRRVRISVLVSVYFSRSLNAMLQTAFLLSHYTKYYSVKNWKIL